MSEERINFHWPTKFTGLGIGRFQFNVKERFNFHWPTKLTGLGIGRCQFNV